VALEQAFETIIDAVIFANMELIKPAVARFQKAREKLEGAISAGQSIKLPKNQDKFFLTKYLGRVTKSIIGRQEMDQHRFYHFGSGFNFYWFYYAQVYPLRLADR
jgi:hypothetical protein